MAQNVLRHVCVALLACNTEHLFSWRDQKSRNTEASGVAMSRLLRFNLNVCSTELYVMWTSAPTNCHTHTLYSTYLTIDVQESLNNSEFRGRCALKAPGPGYSCCHCCQAFPYPSTSQAGP